jgi:hypothetical protein
LRTEEAYAGWVRRFILFHNKRHPAEMGEAEVSREGKIMCLRFMLSCLLLLTFSSCSSASQNASARLKESSTNLDLKYLEPLLLRFIPLIESGFSAQEVGQVVSATKRMKIDEVKKFSFSIRFKATSSTLNIEVRIEDVDAIDIYFFAEPDLAERIAQEIMRFSEEHGL